MTRAGLHRRVPRAACAGVLVVTLGACAGGPGDDGAADPVSGSPSPSASPSVPALPCTTPAPPVPPNAASAVTVTNATDLTVKPVPAGAGQAAEPLTAVAYRDLVSCSGRAVGAADTVSVRYVGARYRDGQEFDASWNRSPQPLTLPLSQFVRGLREGLIGMTAGGRRVLVIPSALGYGAENQGAVLPPNTDLVFVVDLVSIGG